MPVGQWPRVTPGLPADILTPGNFSARSRFNSSTLFGAGIAQSSSTGTDNYSRTPGQINRFFSLERSRYLLPIGNELVKLMGMKTSVIVDDVGRLVLPKEIREAIGVFGRTTVQVEVVDNAARISAPEQTFDAVKRKGKRLVYGGALPDNWESGEAVLKIRARRVRR
jgi:hypothetical protein